ncbi:MAG TPA: transketolase [Bacteroidales bacterium]|jgi:transketolase|nr:transketolase [Bacteroidales bacterium]HPB24157.1 transketolase [Bacteroidales bacterium]HPI29565.1 transketolase [Bacteroidales bacterium]HQN14754.1 transketolase [Bacteroidales bacterium]HQP14448.1 transketolase [Bacteroidales bacterium]
MTTVELAKKIRIHAVNMTHLGKSSHVGAVLSIADILAVLFNDILHVRPDDPKWGKRDRFILSKGHAGAGVYAVLAEKGFFPSDWLKTHYQNGSMLSGHVSHIGIPGVELSTGSLGHGLSVGAGLAMAAKMDKNDYRTFVLMSDGECDEGSVWEAALFAAHHHLHNLIAIIDYNKIQSLAPVKDTINLEPFADKWQSFGWAVKMVDGHNCDELKDVLQGVPFDKNKPNCIIANTIKGKGVSFMENQVLWHYRTPQGEEYDKAINELEGKI